MNAKKLVSGLMCGLMVSALTVSMVSAADTDSCSGRCGTTGVVGTASIKKHSATVTTTQSGNSGTVKVSASVKYRDVSAGKTKTLSGSSSATVNVQKSFSVKEEDYFKSMTGTHSATISNYTWKDTTSVSR